MVDKVQTIELSKDDFVLLGDSLALLRSSAERSIKQHSSDHTLLVAFTDKRDRILRLVAKIQSRSVGL